jgi:hypothetical protein
VTKYLKRKNYLFLLSVSEGSVHGHLTTCFWLYERQNTMAVGVCGRGGYSPQDRKEGERERERERERVRTKDMLPVI